MAHGIVCFDNVKVYRHVYAFVLYRQWHTAAANHPLRAAEPDTADQQHGGASVRGQRRTGSDGTLVQERTTADARRTSISTAWHRLSADRRCVAMYLYWGLAWAISHLETDFCCLGLSTVHFSLFRQFSARAVLWQKPSRLKHVTRISTKALKT